MQIRYFQGSNAVASNLGYTYCGERPPNDDCYAIVGDKLYRHRARGPRGRGWYERNETPEYVESVSFNPRFKEITLTRLEATIKGFLGPFYKQAWERVSVE